MAIGSIPNVGSRVNVTLFASDILSHQGQVSVERYQQLGPAFSVVVRDGAGVQVAISGDRSSLRMILSAALADLGPEFQPEPPEEEPESSP
jgi:hypothetical protein